MKQVTAALITKENKILIAKRKTGPLAGKWEFPGGKIEKGETPEVCLERELKEELDIEIKCDQFFCESKFKYDHESIQLLAYWASYQKGQTVLRVHEEVRWISSSELPNYDFAAADRPIVDKLMKGIANGI